MVPQVFISRAKTKNFTRVFFRIYEPLTCTEKS
ncbi:DUF1661 domain-containing protein [Porphyromonas gingivalis]|nr:DUF1661 domain-containing protein [Porphyromonas gingivalis]USI94063.1 DUF1661 domain-containing protein [Porphyromonas gingivalis]USI95949.1 DUF1661 domain-containing protein [Porphyromonas gingivalis]USI97860.1 DUF1661 domain-containing protein [Porphyromonas gingivalis]WCG01155.1 DUF1661 domain-containing protein [Porphyromonas gingivalis]